MKHRSTSRFVIEGLEGVVVTVGVLATWPVSKRWLRDWGSSPSERERTWPGDQFVSERHTTYTRAIDVDAAPPAVWPWLVQFGLGRAGFYSYELLERVTGIPVRNVESIVPEFQDLAVGDELLLHPKAPGIPVGALAEGSHLCFGKRQEPGDPAGEGDPSRSWSMYIEPQASGSIRLLLRACIEPRSNPTLAQRIGSMIEEPIDFIMEQRMLRTLKRLAEDQSR